MQHRGAESVGIFCLVTNFLFAYTIYISGEEAKGLACRVVVVNACLEGDFMLVEIP
jgi:hypothetical protein